MNLEDSLMQYIEKLKELKNGLELAQEKIEPDYSIYPSAKRAEEMRVHFSMRYVEISRIEKTIDELEKILRGETSR